VKEGKAHNHPRLERSQRAFNQWGGGCPAEPKGAAKNIRREGNLKKKRAEQFRWLQTLGKYEDGNRPKKRTHKMTKDRESWKNGAKLYTPQYKNG